MRRHWRKEEWEEDVDVDNVEQGPWELDPNDETHPDYDLSEAHGYSSWEPVSTPWLMRNGVVIVITLLVIAALLVPTLLFII